jgi:hypothetical protein
MRDALENGPTRTMKVILTNERELHYCKYYFIVNNKQYSGTSSDPSEQPGDTLLIDYVESNPDWNCDHKLYKDKLHRQ